MGIEQNFLLYKTATVESHFYNVVVIASKEKKFEWAREFIEAHQKYLNVKIKDDLLILSNTCLFFYEREYSNAVDLLLRYSFTITTYNNVSKIYLIKCSYELFLQDASFFDLLIAKTLSFEKFMQRDKEMNSERKDTYFNFSQIVRKMAQVRRLGTFSKGAKEELLLKLAQKEKIISRSWLLQKIENE